ncbi:MAG: lipopolysaccharide kinase InaA family protein [Thermoanaerobaculia bacterium]
MVELAFVSRPERPQWESVSRDGLHLHFRADLEPALAAAYANHTWVYDALRAQPGVQLFRGRRPVVGGWLGGTRVVVKRMYHGGLFGKLGRDRFLSCARVRAHHALAEYLSEAGIETAPVVFASWRRVRGLYRCEIGFELVDGIDADRYFFGATPPPAGWERRAAELGRRVARLHQVGFRHGDLNLMNFLFRRDGRVCILDLDKSKVLGRPLTTAEGAPNLDRLERSIRKQGRRHAPEFVEAIIRKVRDAYREAFVEPEDHRNLGLAIVSWGIALATLPLA